ncbi:MAG: hypothetical protein RIR11_2120 [Bacteroidota bacterium]|jgi:hypothetical protein
MAKQQTNRPAPNTAAAAAAPKTAPIRPTAAKSESLFTEGKHDFIFGRQHFILFGAGLGLVLLGLMLMTGGQQVSPDVWDDKVAYSPMRITIAPMMILAGFVAIIVGIFKKA